MATCSIPELLATAACMATLPRGERQIVRLQILCNIVNGDTVANCDIQTLLNDAACFATLPAGQRDILENQLLCAIMQDGGGGGTGRGISTGTGSPEGVVVGGTGENQSQIYIDTATCEIYKFTGTNGSTSGWC